MEYFEAIRDIESKYPTLADHLDLRTAFDDEIAYEEKRSPGRGGWKTKRQRAVNTAHDRILAWLGSADDYQVALTFESMAHFAGSHRKACVWAVLAGKAIRATATRITK